MPYADLPLSEEQGLEEQMQSVEQTISEKIMPTPPSGEVAVTEVPFEGRDLSEGLLSKMPLE